MNLLSPETENQLSQSIIDLVEKTVRSAIKSEDVRYLRQAELMKYAGGVSKETVRKWVMMGLKEIKIGGVVMYDKQDVDRFMIQHKI